MTKYHINPQTGKPNICRAQTPEACKFYTPENGVPPHFNSKEDARAYYEKSREDDTFNTVLSQKTKDNTNNISVENDNAGPVMGSLSNVLPESMKSLTDKCIHLEEDYGEISPIGVYSAKISGELVRPYMYCETQNSGVINHHHLDENSYKEFGFQDQEEPRHTDDKTIQLGLMSNSVEMSPEISELSEGQLKTFEIYSWGSNDFNYPLYNKDKSPHKTTFHGYYDDNAEATKENGEVVESASENKDYQVTYDDAVRTIDKVMDKSPGIQKIVYRGIQKRNHTPPGLDSWDDIELGKELRFDSFSSTSASYGIARSFSDGDDEGRVVFEIKTASAVNMMEASDYFEECEYLVPRGSRFMVVGKKVDAPDDYPQVSAERKKGDTIIQLVEINEKGEIVDNNNIKETQKLRKEYNNKNSPVKWSD